MWYSLVSRLPCRSAAAGYRRCQTTATKPQCGVRQHRLYGQPTAATHPHLLQEGELTPGLKRQEFADRRKKLVDDILQLCAVSVSPGMRTAQNHAVVVLSATKAYMSDKIPYPFRQNSDFLYLTGFQEPDSALVIHIGADYQEPKSVMFVPQRDAHAELWDGPCAGPDGAVELLGVDAAYEIGELENYIGKLLKGKFPTTFWYDNAPGQPEASGILRRLADSNKSNVSVESPRLLIQKLRLIKSGAEQELMRQTCRVACEAMTEVMRTSHSGVTEAQLHSKMEFECRIRGAQRLAYPPVVAGGARANIIHYVANDQRILGGELVLMDGGCELNGYTSDLTRTWPVSGQFEPGQRELYELLWDVQQMLLRKLEEPMSLDSLFHVMCAQLGVRLREAGILSPSTPESELVQVEAKTKNSEILAHVKDPQVVKINLEELSTMEAHQLCPHHVGHYLGMDVHDTPLIPRSLRLAPGCVLTVEPGIYIPESNTKVAAKFRGVGMRIEDDVLMTSTGPEVLTKACAREVDVLENLSRGFPASKSTQR